MSRSVYFASNSHQNLYNENTRAAFKSDINLANFKHLKDGDLYVGIRSIIFDNTYNAIEESKNGTPHLILFSLFSSYTSDYTHDKTFMDRYVSMGEDEPYDLTSGKDYVMFYDNNSFGETKHLNHERGFTDIKFYYENFVIHNIYLHPATFHTSEEFVNFLNDVHLKVTLDPLNSEHIDKDKFITLQKDGTCLIKNTAYDGYGTYIGNLIARVLGIRRIQSTGSEDSRISRRDAFLGAGIHSFSDWLIKQSLPKKLQPDNVAEPTTITEPKFDYEYEENSTAVMHVTGDTKIDFLVAAHEIWAQNTVDGDHGKWLHTELFKAKNARLMGIWYEIKKHSYYFMKVRSLYSHVMSKAKVNVSANKPEMIAIRSSFSNPDITNGGFDTFMAYISVEDVEIGVRNFEIKSPTFYKTTIEKLSKSYLTMIDIETNEVPQFAIGNPTYIHFICKTDLNKMHKQFNVFLDSSDEHSSKFFPSNMNTDFRIRLPQRLEFNRKWKVALKAIFIGNDMFNIYSDTCYILYKYILNDPETGEAVDIDGKICLADGLYESKKTIYRTIKKLLAENEIPIDLKHKSSRFIFEKNNEMLVDCKIILSPYLSGILGFNKNVEVGYEMRFISDKVIHKATYEPEINLLMPQNFMVLTDIVKESVFGAQNISILKLLSAVYNEEAKIIHFEHYIDEFMPLGTYEFSIIRIRITDATGNILKTMRKRPTRLQLQFSV